MKLSEENKRQEAEISTLNDTVRRLEEQVEEKQ